MLTQKYIYQNGIFRKIGALKDFFKHFHIFIFLMSPNENDYYLRIELSILQNTPSSHKNNVIVVNSSNFVFKLLIHLALYIFP